MHAFPHHYHVTASGTVDGDVELAAERLPSLPTATPAEFDGPGDQRSPGTLLVGAVADCFALTFRGVARASKLPWTSLRCDVTGRLEQIDRVAQFTHFDVCARVELPPGTDTAAALRVMEKAERGCLIANSMKATVHLEPEIHVAAEPAGVLAEA